MNSPSAGVSLSGHPAAHPSDETSRAVVKDSSTARPAPAMRALTSDEAAAYRRVIDDMFRGEERHGHRPAWADLSAFLGVLVLLLAAGCGTSQAGRVLRAENDYAFARARYAEQCPEPPVDVGCVDLAKRLKAWHGAIQEAAEALKRGGDCPLQIERLEKLAKEYPR